MTIEGATAPQAAITTRPGWIRFLLGFAVVVVVLMGSSEVDATGRWGPAILAAVLGAALLVERVLFGTGPRDALHRLGFGRPGRPAVVVAVVVAGVVLLTYPAFTAITGLVAELRPDWVWRLLTCRS